MDENIKKSSNSSIKIAFLIGLLVVGWFASGAIPKEIEPETVPIERELPTVRAMKISAETVPNIISIKGVSRASRMVSLRAELDGRVQRIIAEDGAKMKGGQHILQIDPRDRFERVRQAEAEVEEQLTQYESAQKLVERGLQSEVRLSAARSDYEDAKARLKQAQIDLDNIKIRAPFTGRLEKVLIEQGDYVQAGDKVADFIDNDPFLIVAEIPENQISEIRKGKEVDIKLASGAEYQGEVSFVAAVANDQTRSFTIEVEVDNPGGEVFDGMTANMKINAGELTAHKLSPAFLNLQDDGTIGVKTVEKMEVEGAEENKVGFYKIEILNEDENGIWVSGLPQDVEIITTGHKFVEEGAKINVQAETIYQKPNEG